MHNCIVDIENRSNTYDICQNFLSQIFNGNEIEHISFDFSKKEGNVFWNNWVEQSQIAWEEYRNTIHPAISEVAIKILSQVSSTPTILEIGGGEGQLAEGILRKISRTVHYIFLEMNKVAVERARLTLSQYPVTVVEGDVLEKVDYCNDSAKLNAIEKKSVDLVIGSGILTDVVLKNPEEGLKVLSNVAPLVKPGGYIILSGHAKPLVTANDLEQWGFKVLNKTLPGWGRHFYVARKRAVDTAAIPAGNSDLVSLLQLMILNNGALKF